MKWQCLRIRNHSNYPMIIISKRVYPITIFCGNLFELRAPLHWKIVANTSCDRPKVAKNRAVSEAQGPLLFVVCHSFIVCCHGFLPRFVSSRPGSRVFFHNKKTRWSTSLARRLFFAFSPWKLWTTYGSPPLASTKLVLGAFPPAAAALSCSIRTSLQQETYTAQAHGLLEFEHITNIQNDTVQKWNWWQQFATLGDKSSG